MERDEEARAARSRRPSGPWLLVGLMAVTVVALLAALLVTRGDDVDVDALLAAAPVAVDEQGSAHLAMSVRLDDDALDVSVDGIGAVDFASGAGWFTVDLLGRSIELRTDGEVLYVLPSGQTTWLAVNAEDADAVGGFGTGPSEAIAFVDLLRGTAGDVDDLGTEEIDGNETRHLQLSIDLETAVAQADERAKKAIEALATVAPEGTLPFEVWIDERDLPVRQRLHGELQGVDLVITVDLTGWGEDLGVAIPPEGEVRPIEPEELTQIFGGQPTTP